jgi:hypothetical protein
MSYSTLVMRNEMVMDQVIPFYKPNKKSKECENDGLYHFLKPNTLKV